MPDRLVERTLRAFSDDLASDAPVPGGGSAAAYAGAMGAALAAMVARITAKKEGLSDSPDFIGEMDRLRGELLRLVDADSAAYARVAEAMRLPRKTEEEKRARTDRLQAALVTASEVPLEVAKTARRLLEACERSVVSASPMTASEVMSGVPMCRVSGQCRGARRFRPARSWPNMQRRWASCAAGLLRQNRPPPSRFATMRRPMAVDVDSHHERVVEPRLTDTLIDGIHFALFLRPSRTDSFSDAFEMARTAIAVSHSLRSSRFTPTNSSARNRPRPMEREARASTT